MPIDLSSINPTAVILGIIAFAVLVGAIASSGSNNGNQQSGGNNNNRMQQNNNNCNRPNSQQNRGSAKMPFGNLFGNKKQPMPQQNQDGGVFGVNPSNNQHNANQQNFNNNGNFQNQNNGFAQNQSGTPNNNPTQNNQSNQFNNNNGIF